MVSKLVGTTVFKSLLEGVLALKKRAGVVLTLSFRRKIASAPKDGQRYCPKLFETVQDHTRSFQSQHFFKRRLTHGCTID